MSEKLGGSFSLETYLNKQEGLLLEYIRKTLQAETKITLLETALQEMYKKNEDLNQQIETQNNTIEQSIAGLQAVTVEKDKAQNRIKNLEQALEDCNVDRGNARTTSNENANKAAVLETEIEKLNNEIEVVTNDYAILKENYNKVLAALKEAQKNSEEQDEIKQEVEESVVVLPTKKKRSKKEKAQDTDSEWVDGEYKIST